MAVRDRLGPEERSRFDVQYLIPIGQPDAVPKKQWRKKKNHGKANAPGLTAAQSSDKDRLEADRLARGKARAITPELEMERVPATPPQRKRTNTLVERGRERTRTTKGAESKALGLLAESQPRE